MVNFKLTIIKEEVRAALKRMKSEKALGSDDITVDGDVQG